MEDQEQAQTPPLTNEGELGQTKEFEPDPHESDATPSTPSLETLEQQARNPETPWESLTEGISQKENSLQIEKGNAQQAVEIEMSDVTEIMRIQSELGVPASLPPEKEAKMSGALHAGETAVDAEGSLQHIKQVAAETHAQNPVEQMKVFESQEDQRLRSVAEVSKRNKQFILHGIMMRKETHPTDNSQIQADTHFMQKIDILRSLKPEVSCSSFKAGEPYSGGWSSVGALLGGGEIVHAEKGDAGTVAREDGTRAIIGEKGQSHADVDKVLQENSNDSYNELVVRNPEVSGLYVNIDRISDKIEKELNIPWQLQYSLAEHRAKVRGISVDEIEREMRANPQLAQAQDQSEAEMILQKQTEYAAVVQKKMMEDSGGIWKNLSEMNHSKLPQYIIHGGRPLLVKEWTVEGPVIGSELTTDEVGSRVENLSFEQRKELLHSIPDQVFRKSRPELWRKEGEE